jgi:hypothetical protein
MGFLDRLRKALSGGGNRGSESDGYWVYVQCRRCGEPLKARIDLRNEPSQTDDGEGWVVRKGLIGTGAQRCFQTVEVTLTFDVNKRDVTDQEVTGGTFITEAEYEAALEALKHA